jgi:hypothetical protein
VTEVEGDYDAFGEGNAANISTPATRPPPVAEARTASRMPGGGRLLIHGLAGRSEVTCVKLKRFPIDLNRWDSQRVKDERVFGH